MVSMGLKMEWCKDDKKRYSLIYRGNNEIIYKNKLKDSGVDALITYYESIKDRKYVQLGDTDVIMRGEDLIDFLLLIIKAEKAELFEKLDSFDDLNIGIKDDLTIGDRF